MQIFNSIRQDYAFLANATFAVKSQTTATNHSAPIAKKEAEPSPASSMLIKH